MLNKWILVNNNHITSFSASFLCLVHPSITQSHTLLMQGQGSVTLASCGVSGPNDVLGSSAVSRWLMTVPFAEPLGSALPGPSDTIPSLMKRAPAAPEYTRAPDDPLTKTQRSTSQSQRVAGSFYPPTPGSRQCGLFGSNPAAGSRELKLHLQTSENRDNLISTSCL